MSSITSVIAFFILLLATFSYSAPIGQEYGNSTPDYELTTSQSMDDREKPLNMRNVVDDQSTNTPLIQNDRSSESNEVTTEDVTRPPRSFEDSTYSPAIDRKSERNFDEYSSTPRMNDKRIYEDSTPVSSSESTEEYSTTPSIEIKQKRKDKDLTKPLSSESSEEPNRDKYSSPSPMNMNEKRLFEESTYSPTSESSEERNRDKYSSPSPMNMNEKRLVEESTSSPTSESSEEQKRDALEVARVLDPKRSLEEFLYTTLESSTQFNERTIRPVESEEVESSTMDSIKQTKKNVEPSSSVHSFGKYTGLLADAQNTTPEYETTDRPVEESTKESVEQPERLTKIVSIIPGKITETKIYSNVPSKTSVIIQPIEQEQLSQGSTLLLFLLAALLFSAFLMASTIAIFKINQSLKRRSRITEMEADLEKQLLK